MIASAGSCRGSSVLLPTLVQLGEAAGTAGPHLHPWSSSATPGIPCRCILWYWLGFTPLVWQCLIEGVTHLTLRLYTHGTFMALEKRNQVCTILFHLKSWKYQLKTFHAADVEHLLLKSFWGGPWVVGDFSFQSGYIII